VYLLHHQGLAKLVTDRSFHREFPFWAAYNLVYLVSIKKHRF
jgi:hypothetical protein